MLYQDMTPETRRLCRRADRRIRITRAHIDTLDETVAGLQPTIARLEEDIELLERQNAQR